MRVRFRWWLWVLHPIKTRKKKRIFEGYRYRVELLWVPPGRHDLAGGTDLYEWVNDDRRQT